MKNSYKVADCGVDNSRYECPKESGTGPTTVVRQTVTAQRPKETADCKQGQNQTDGVVDLCKEDHSQEKKGSGE